MKKILSILFICLCMALCLIPSVGMLFGSPEQIAGNEMKTDKPSIQTKDGALNTNYLPELGNYFEKNFGFRTQIITADNRLMSTLFGVSDTSTVLVGKNGWLYYTATLDDYCGTDTLTEDQATALVQNIEILRDYAESRGSEFLFTVAPNKNTLYPENMPYYYLANTAKRNRDLLHEALQNSDLHYCNLFDVLDAQEETLYLKTDSHWNNKGALLAYNTILDTLGKPHEDFAAANVTRNKDFRGDLSNMLYPASDEKEYNYTYPTDSLFSYVTDTKSTEEPLIQTKCPTASGSLYMYRDSFGNALVPFFATSFEGARFTKSFPMILENDVPPGSADTVIFEIAERNINWFLTMPPVVSAPELAVYEVQNGTERDTELQMKECEYSPAYIAFPGKLEYDVTEGSPVYLRITQESGTTRTYRCFRHLSDSGENGFLAYLKSDAFVPGEQLNISVLVEKNSEFYQIDTQTFKNGE